jgi:hypothetical protein
MNEKILCIVYNGLIIYIINPSMDGRGSSYPLKKTKETALLSLGVLFFYWKEKNNVKE